MSLLAQLGLGVTAGGLQGVQVWQQSAWQPAWQQQQPNPYEPSPIDWGRLQQQQEAERRRQNRPTFVWGEEYD